MPVRSVIGGREAVSITLQSQGFGSAVSLSVRADSRQDWRCVSILERKWSALETTVLMVQRRETGGLNLLTQGHFYSEYVGGSIQPKIFAWKTLIIERWIHSKNVTRTERICPFTMMKITTDQLLSLSHLIKCFFAMDKFDD